MVVLQQIATALAYMHSNEITHNDMKRGTQNEKMTPPRPENIFLHSDGRPPPISTSCALSSRPDRVQAGRPWLGREVDKHHQRRHTCLVSLRSVVPEVMG